MTEPLADRVMASLNISREDAQLVINIVTTRFLDLTFGDPTQVVDDYVDIIKEAATEPPSERAMAHYYEREATRKRRVMMTVPTPPAPPPPDLKSAKEAMEGTMVEIARYRELMEKLGAVYVTKAATTPPPPSAVTFEKRGRKKKKR
jgi:hypothetical protein